MSIQQIPLNLHLRDEAIFDNFYAGKNETALLMLQNFMLQTQDHYFFCYGEKGSGKSHLLQASCHWAAKKGRSFFYLPLLFHHEFSPAILDDLDAVDLLCIDDIEAVAGKPQWEEKLFYLYNRMQENAHHLLISAHCPANQIRFLLKDLHSRLMHGVSLEIHPLSDHDKTNALQLRASLRGIQLSDEVIQYLLSHYSRNMNDLFTYLDELDKASLIAKRKITIPFVKMVIKQDRNHVNH